MRRDSTTRKTTRDLSLLAAIAAVAPSLQLCLGGDPRHVALAAVLLVAALGVRFGRSWAPWLLLLAAIALPGPIVAGSLRLAVTAVAIGLCGMMVPRMWGLDRRATVALVMGTLLCGVALGQVMGDVPARSEQPSPPCWIKGPPKPVPAQLELRVRRAEHPDLLELTVINRGERATTIKLMPYSTGVCGSEGTFRVEARDRRGRRLMTRELCPGSVGALGSLLERVTLKPGERAIRGLWLSGFYPVGSVWPTSTEILRAHREGRRLNVPQPVEELSLRVVYCGASTEDAGVIRIGSGSSPPPRGCISSRISMGPKPAVHDIERRRAQE